MDFHVQRFFSIRAASVRESVAGMCRKASREWDKVQSRQAGSGDGRNTWRGLDVGFTSCVDSQMSALQGMRDPGMGFLKSKNACFATAFSRLWKRRGICHTTGCIITKIMFLFVRQSICLRYQHWVHFHVYTRHFCYLGSFPGYSQITFRDSRDGNLCQHNSEPSTVYDMYV